MAKKKGSKIGFDPLAWMKQGSVPDKSEQAKADLVPAPVKPAKGATAPVPSAAPVNAPPAVRSITVGLGDAIGMSDVGAIREKLGQALDNAKTILLDGAEVRVAHTAGLQLLLSFMQTARNRGVRVEWQAPSPALRDASRQLGMDSSLQFPEG
jgi:anti-anti-sigma regulatory factor